REVSEIFKQVLGLSRVGVNDDFFELGGHSLLATQVIARVREALGVEVALKELFEQPTVAGVAARVDNGGGEGIPPITRVGRDIPLPLSYPQERIWFICQLDPQNVSYNVPRVLRLKGRLSLELLERTVTELMRRHEILRTTFPSVEGRPVQLVHAPTTYRMSVADLSGLDEQEREQELMRVIEAESRRVFDLEAGPLLRLLLVRMGPFEQVLVLVEHHLIHDGWTQGVLVRDVMAIYGAYAEGKPSPLEELEVQYGDFAAWQRQWVSGEVMSRQLEYWRRQLEGARGLLELPADRVRPAVASGRGGEQILEVSGELGGRLRELSREQGATLFQVMLAGFKVMLNRYSGEQDILVGTGIANRRRRETEGLLGMIINTQVLRTDLGGDPSFEELVGRVREVTLGAYENQDVPFDRVVEELGPERSLSYNPIAQVFFTFFDVPMEEMRLPGIEIEEIEAHNRSAKFDLGVIVLLPSEQRVGLGGVEQPGEIRIVFEYSTDLYEEETIRRMM
ncbi:MAG TPA: condensation domain-containing protein, partial [Pyrinomonadaceae bacterium]|nr:condensation domain-containing protein [Pyrinomonadaceae bacterium]